MKGKVLNVLLFYTIKAMFTPVLDSFLWQHEKLFVIVGAPIWYAVALHFRDLHGAASLR